MKAALREHRERHLDEPSHRLLRIRVCGSRHDGINQSID
jgi:hypothetical protein